MIWSGSDVDTGPFFFYFQNDNMYHGVKAFSQRTALREETDSSMDKISDKITDKMNYFTDPSRLGPKALQSVHNTVIHNNAVETITGYYDDELSILSASQILLDNLGYTAEEFAAFTQGSFKNLFYGENRSFLEPDRLPFIKGAGEGGMLTKNGTPVTVRLYKEDDTDEDGNAI